MNKSAQLCEMRENVRNKTPQHHNVPKHLAGIYLNFYWETVSSLNFLVQVDTPELDQNVNIKYTKCRWGSALKCGLPLNYYYYFGYCSSQRTDDYDQN